MSDDIAADFEKLQNDFRALSEGVRMIRRAVDRASRSGALPPMEQGGMTPIQECEAIARVIYRAAFKLDSRASAATLAGLAANDASN